MEDWNKDRRSLLGMLALTAFMIAQIIFFFIFIDHGNIDLLKYIGYFSWALSALFGWLPIYEFRRKGKVPKGKSYMHTTTLVSSGVYSIVRHPQYLAGILLCTAFMLVSQHWLVIILGIPPIIILCRDMLRADRSGVEKFGRAYERYMRKVPRMNFVWGAIKKLVRSCDR